MEIEQARHRREGQSRAARDLAQLQEQADLKMGSRPRGLAGCLLGFVVTLCCVGLWIAQQTGSLDYGVALSVILAFVAASLVGSGMLYPWDWNDAGRRQLRIMIVMILGLLAHWVGCCWLGVPIQEAIAWNALLAAAMLAVAGVAFDTLAITPSVTYLVTWVAIPAAPGLTVELFGVGNFLAYFLWSVLSDSRGRR